MAFDGKGNGSQRGDEGESRSRRWRVIFAVFVVIQLLVPLTYYLREDAYDERFAWRMFSAVRMYRCQTQAVEDRGDGLAPVNLSQLIHRAWINHLGRNRQDVVHAYLHRRCAEPGMVEARVINRCSDERGDGVAPQTYVIDCAEGTIALSGGDGP